ncbi:GntR family transcriptional regulator [Microvirga sp. TS319]|uniref:GntR family transcriptional regulator n=1 Tax=Microvirga sp. TS319 TaxID=3241165 RepID=UPI00351A9255
MLHDEVVSRVRHMLMEGEIPPGARVPERDLCLTLGISRTPLREALKVLAAEGYVVLLPNRGARAAKLTQKDVQDLFEVCESLEAAAGELACQRITDDQVRRIACLHDEMVSHYRNGDLLQYYRCNRSIHEAIVDAADNAALASLYESVTARIRRARFVVPMPPSHWELAVQEHEAILNALQRRDGCGLSHILRRHLRHKRQEVERAGFAESAEGAQLQTRRMPRTASA